MVAAEVQDQLVSLICHPAFSESAVRDWFFIEI